MRKLLWDYCLPAKSRLLLYLIFLLPACQWDLDEIDFAAVHTGETGDIALTSAPGARQYFQPEESYRLPTWTLLLVGEWSLRLLDDKNRIGHYQCEDMFRASYLAWISELYIMSGLMPLSVGRYFRWRQSIQHKTFWRFRRKKQWN